MCYEMSLMSREFRNFGQLIGRCGLSGFAGACEKKLPSDRHRDFYFYLDFCLIAVEEGDCHFSLLLKTSIS
jgi:hypothetical protein